MGEVRVVLDTNVLVSALGYGGKPEDCLVTAMDEAVPVTSEEILDEVDRVMGYDDLPIEPSERREFLRVLRGVSEVVNPDERIDAVEDSDDDKFLEAAVEADADYIVSGDDDLLSVGEFRETEILSPAEFLEKV